MPSASTTPGTRELADAVAGAAARLDFSRVTVIPVSALAGDNVTTVSPRTEWYAGPTVITAIGETHELDALPATASRPARSRSRRSSARTGSAGWPARWSPDSSRSATRCPWRGPA